MSLDIYLIEDGVTVFDANITHNLGKMAQEAGIYNQLWRPEEHGITRAGDLIGPLAKGLDKLVTSPTLFKQLDPANGWGSWRDFVPWVAEYLEACRQHPDARVEVSR